MTYYERWYQLQATLQSLQFYENLDFSVIIVDDGSVEQPLISEFLSKQGFSNNYNFPVKIF
jgi:glycosyltransferase involved in cell wall biosynthesis